MKQRTVLLFLLGASAVCFMVSCTPEPEYIGWSTIPIGNPRPKTAFNEVLVIDQTPNVAYTKVGHISPPGNSIVRVSFSDSNMLQFFKKQAAELGANTVVLHNSPIEYRSGLSKSTSIDLLYVSDENSSHGGDELNVVDKSPLADDLLHIY